MHSTLAIDDGRVVSAYTQREFSGRRVGVGVVEGVEGITWRDLDAKVGAGCQVANVELHSVCVGVPKEENFIRRAQSLGQFSSRCARAFACCGQRAAVVGDAPYKAGGFVVIGLDLLACRVRVRVPGASGRLGRPAAAGRSFFMVFLSEWLISRP